MASTAAAAAPTAGVWFGELSAALQGKWEAMLGQQQQQQVVGAAVQAKKKAAAATSGAASSAGKPREEDGKIGGCGGAMSDTTVYLLLDRFAPS